MNSSLLFYLVLILFLAAALAIAVHFVFDMIQSSKLPVWAKIGLYNVISGTMWLLLYLTN